MSLKKKISIAATTLCTVAAVVMCLLLYREWTTPDIIEVPLKKLYWGMTLGEAEAVLAEVGIEKVLKGSLDDNGMWKQEEWTLTIEQAEMLGFAPVGNLKLSTIKNWPVHVGFSSSGKNGILRLVNVSIVIEVDASKAVTSFDKIEYIHKEISKVYGKPANDEPSFWCYWRLTDDPDPITSSDPALVVRDKAVGAKETLLEYSGNLYVMSLYGGRYSDVVSRAFM